jgi:hypothetical protein
MVLANASKAPLTPEKGRHGSIAGVADRMVNHSYHPFACKQGWQFSMGVVPFGAVSNRVRDWIRHRNDNFASHRG